MMKPEARKVSPYEKEKDSVSEQMTRIKRFYLPEFEAALSKIDKTLKRCQEAGIRITQKSISDHIGFDPWRYLRYIYKRFERAEALIQVAEWKCRPKLALKNTFYGFESQAEEMPTKSMMLMNEAREYVRNIIVEQMLLYKRAGEIEKADKFASIIIELDNN